MGYRYQKVHDEIPVSLVVMNNGTVDSVTDNIPTNYVVAKTTLNGLAAPEPEYAARYTPDANLAKLVKNDLGTEDVKVTISGNFDSDSTTNSDHFYLQIRQGDGSLLTGTVQRYSAGRGVGATISQVGFTLVGYGRLVGQESVQLEVAKDFNGTCILTDALISIERIRGDT